MNRSSRQWLYVLPALLACTALLAGGQEGQGVRAMTAKDFVPYRPAAKNAWDFWFAQAGSAVHAFYLEYPDAQAQPDQSRRHGGQWVGHAVSTDLAHWTEQPTALREPGLGIATGSVVRHGGKWYMLVTHKGFSLAESDDLQTWRWTDGNPVYRGEVLEADWQGKRVTFRMLADPYVYPELRDGFWYAAVNSHIEGGAKGELGAQVLVRSKDLRQWEGWKVIAWPRTFERMETSQIWEHAGRWYLYFGGVIDNARERRNANFIYVGAQFDGPYEAQPWSEMTLPDVPYWYIGKRLVAPDGTEVFLAGQSYSSLSRPLRMRYTADGSIAFE